MRKLLIIALLVLTASYAQAETSSMDSGAMCQECSCCQKMMEGGMKMDEMKSGMKCPMMEGEQKEGMKCGCCKGMMEGETKNQSTSTPKTPAAVSAEEHKQHHPEQ